MKFNNVTKTVGEGMNDAILAEFKLRSPALAKTPEDMLYYSNLYNKTFDHGNIMPAPGIHTFLNRSEQAMSDLTYKEFSYHVNNMGYRDPYPLVGDKDIFGFFGCSCTFGVGLDSNDNFPAVVSNHFNKKCLNLGQPGTGAYRIGLIFAAAANVWNMETAVVTLPNYARFHYVDLENKMKSIHLPWDTKYHETETIRINMLDNFSDNYLLSQIADTVYYIAAVAKLKNINLILSAWDPNVMHIIETVLNYRVPSFNFWTPGEPFISGDHSRDKIHPGVNIVNNYVKKLKDSIVNSNYVKI